MTPRYRYCRRRRSRSGPQSPKTDVHIGSGCIEVALSRFMRPRRDQGTNPQGDGSRLRRPLASDL